MIRIVIFIAIVFALTLGATLLINVEGETVMYFGDIVFNAPSWAVIMLLSACAMVIVAATLFLYGVLRMPKAIARHHRDRRRVKGLTALTRGLEAVAAGDATDAQRHAKMASRQLKDEAGLTRLLTAQAAQLAGDEVTAEQSFAAMLEAPETEFLGLRGLYLQAMKQGDRKEAREYAERAFRLRPGTEWAYQSVYTLHLDRGAWGDARDILIKAQQHGHEGGEPAKRREAALLTAMAYGAEAGGEADTARREANEALKKAPGFAPAAVLAARLEGNAGRRSKATKILDEAWAIAPHPAIAKTMADLYKDEPLERRAERLTKLAEKKPEADESQLLIAEQENARGDHAAARERLEPLLTRNPRARTFSAMATAIRHLYGDAAASVWQDRAAAAPLDPVPGADGDFHFTTDGWKRLIREYGDHDRMAPPPLEELRTSLTVEEVRLLLAPPVITETAIEDEAPAAIVDAEVAEPETSPEAEPDPIDDQQAVEDAAALSPDTDTPETDEPAASADQETDAETKTSAEGDPPADEEDKAKEGA
ncbi:heme biosynthesis HemY N-terminal domain-containing protein [Parvularcula marina]|uniref:heme biosynthesis protein HemY n=1 Tax=Parvularcula marina TaxID=2292771 RepID=UPI0035142E12